MVKLIGVLLLTASISGCYAYTPVKFAADKVCNSTEAKQVVLMEEMDEVTFPHTVRVKCNVQK